MTQNMDPDELLRAGEVARAVGVDRTTIHRWAANGRIPSVEIAGQRFFRRSTIDDLVEDVERRRPLPGRKKAS